MEQQLTGRPQIRVDRRASERLRDGHLWVYRTEMEGSVAATAGALADVLDFRGSLIGTATYSSSSKIALRLLTHGHPLAADGLPALIQERVRSALRRRSWLANAEQTTDAARLLFSEADGLPGVIVDRYADLVVVQLLTQTMAQDAVRSAISAELGQAFAEAEPALCGGAAASGEGPSGNARRLTVWERTDPRIRELEELPPPADQPLLVLGTDNPVPTTHFHLNGLAFAYNVNAGQKTGAFLDQRLNYRAAAETVKRLGGAAAVRALDVCTYQGGFALHLAQVCERVTGVDASRTALEVADTNLERNTHTVRAEVDWIEADAFTLLRAWDEAGERFGTVVLDPPAFAKGKRAVEGALRGYKEMNLRALRMLEPGGVLVTCSCSHHVSEAMLREVLGAAAADAKRQVQVLESRGAAPDHPEIASLPETRYLKCLICRVE